MSLGWAGAVTDQHHRIAARRDGVETFEAANSPELAKLLADWQAAHPDRHPVRVLLRPCADGKRVDVQWRVKE